MSLSSEANDQVIFGSLDDRQRWYAARLAEGKVHRAKLVIADREQSVIERERRLLRKPFLSERTIQIMYETCSILFLGNPT